MALWLWPLFNEARWGAWRQDQLGLPPCPYEAKAEVAINPDVKTLIRI